MNENKPDWYQKLRSDPLTKKGFTMDHINHIERLAGESAKKEAKRKMNRRIPAIIMGVTVLVLFIGVLFNIDSINGWIKGDGTKPGVEAPIPATTPTPTPDMEPSIEPTSTPEDEAPLDPLADETLIQVAIPEDGVLTSILPFTTEEVKEISLRTKAGNVIPVEEGIGTIMGELSNVFFIESIADPSVKHAADIAIRFHVEDKIYMLPYDSKHNTLGLGNDEVYADDHTARLILSLSQPDGEFGRFAAMLKNSSSDLEVDNEIIYEIDRFDMNGMDFYEWDEELVDVPTDWSLPFYYWLSEAMSAVNSYDNGGILTYSLTKVFTTDKYKTKDGIAVGSTKDEIMEKLGEPNRKSDTKWGYINTEWEFANFFLYFEGDTVKYIELKTSI